MPIIRIVLLLTPIVAPIAGWLATQSAQHAPGLGIKEAQLNEIFLAGLGLVLAGSAQWVHGYQKHEAREAEAVREADIASDAELEVTDDERSVIAPELLEDLDDDDLLEDAGDPLLGDENDDEALELALSGDRDGQ